MTVDRGVVAARVLARAATRTSVESLPSDVRDRAVDILLDTVAVTALASQSPELTALRERLVGGERDEGPASVIGAAHGTHAVVAALVNGSGPAALQADEGHRRSRGHPAIHIVPAAVAVAERNSTGGVGGADLLAAVVVGYEVATRVGLSLGGLASTLHPHGNWSTVGAAAASAYLASGGDEGVIAKAIDGSAALIPMPDRGTLEQGASLHYMYPGIGAQIAVSLALGVDAGLAVSPGTLERFFGPAVGAGFDPARLTAGVGADGSWDTYEIADNYFKLYPCCGHTHTAVDALGTLLDQHRAGPDDVDDITVLAYREASVLGNQSPSTDLQARFSIPHILAVRAVTGDVKPDAFGGTTRDDPRIRRLTAQVRVDHDPALDGGYPDGRPVVVQVRFADGSTDQRRVDVSPGDATRMIGREDRHAKAHAYLASAFGADAADGVVAAVLGLADTGTVADLTAAIRAAASDT